jgi:hypothetical protein
MKILIEDRICVIVPTKEIVTKGLGREWTTIVVGGDSVSTIF